MDKPDSDIEISTELDIDRTFSDLKIIIRTEQLLLDCYRAANLDSDRGTVGYQLTQIFAGAADHMGRLRFAYEKHLNELHDDLDRSISSRPPKA